MLMCLTHNFPPCTQPREGYIVILYHSDLKMQSFFYIHFVFIIVWYYIVEVMKMNKKQGIFLGIFIGLLVILAFVYWYFSIQWAKNNENPYYGHMVGGWGMPFGMLAMGIFWIGVIYFAFNGFSYRSECRHERAIEVLKSRLAQGEITIDEYEKLMEQLRK